MAHESLPALLASMAATGQTVPDGKPYDFLAEPDTQMSTVYTGKTLPPIQFGRGPICADPLCNRRGPHYPREYGCRWSSVAVYLTPDDYGEGTPVDPNKARWFKMRHK